MKTRLTNPANFLIMAIMVAAIFIFSCSSGGDGCVGDNCYVSGISSSGDDNSSSSKRQLPDLGNSSSSSVTAGGGTSSSGTSSSSGGNTSCTDNSSGAGPSLAYEGKTYKTVKIGCQTWMAENLDYAVEGSTCYDGDPANCVKYGRLYDWSTAMGLDASCNSSTCSNLIQTKHRGVCPSGWHIPSNAEWDALYRFADGTNGTSSPYNSPTAGKHLKAKDGWNSCGPSGSGKSYSCEDTYGFAALPGGYGKSDGDFFNVGRFGRWWSASEDFSYDAYYRGMYYSGEGADGYFNDKDDLFSVRCVKDD